VSVSDPEVVNAGWASVDWTTGEDPLYLKSWQYTTYVSARWSTVHKADKQYAEVSASSVTATGL